MQRGLAQGLAKGLAEGLAAGDPPRFPTPWISGLAEGLAARRIPPPFPTPSILGLASGYPEGVDKSLAKGNPAHVLLHPEFWDYLKNLLPIHIKSNQSIDE